MSGSGALHSPLDLITVGDFDPQSDRPIEFDFIGRKIADRYVVHAHIGGGGMADVYRATDEVLGVDVAIKLLKPALASADLRARMVQEARAAAQVRHPHLVRVFGTGALDATAYIVMELLDGPNLDFYLRERPGQRLPWSEALDLLLPALAALHAIHERGYVHRDIKPGNILITRAPGCEPFAVVIDLGLVKADRALRTADSPPTTAVGRLLCTPGYTSPEQALGRRVDARSDVYSMAITLYRVLTGRLPFHEVRGGPLAAVLARHIFADPTLLADAAGTADIPAAVADVVHAGLRKDPDLRPQTMLAFALALRAAADTAKTAAVRRRAVRPHPLLTGFALGAVAVWLVLTRSAPPPAALSASLGRAERVVRAVAVVLAAAREVGPARANAMHDPEAAALSGPLASQGAVDPTGDLPAGGPDAGDRSDAGVSPGSSKSSESSGSSGSSGSSESSGSSRAEESAKPAITSDDPGTGHTDDRGVASASRAARVQVLAAMTPEIQRCADKSGPGVNHLAVDVQVSRRGVSTFQVEGGATVFVRCVREALKPRTLPPGPKDSFTYTFRLRASVLP